MKSEALTPEDMVKLAVLYRQIGEYPYIRCPEHDLVLLTFEEYDLQMKDPDSRWQCPYCGQICWWEGSDFEP